MSFLMSPFSNEIPRENALLVHRRFLGFNGGTLMELGASGSSVEKSFGSKEVQFFS